MALEFLQVAETVAREKSINKEQVLEAMEQAIQTAARRKFGMHLNIHAVIDRVDGEVTLKKIVEVVKQVMEPVSAEEVRLAHREMRDVEMRAALDCRTGKPLSQNDIQVLLEVAKKQNPEIELGDTITEDLPPMDFGRIAAQAAKQVIFQKVRDAEREKEFEEFKDSANQIISGIVKRSDYNGLTIDLGKVEAYMPKDEMIPRESYRQGDRVRALIFKVERQVRGPQIFLSRTHPSFIQKLFEEEVPEIGTGIIELMGVARDPGFRAKIAVKSQDHNLDPVGACVGIRGSRVQGVTQELQGERVDIIEWSADPAQYLVRALAPAEVSKVVLDEDADRIEVVVPEDKLSIAIGRRGQNVRLASMLTGWDIDIMTEQEESERRAKEFDAISTSFIENLDIDETLARLLIAEGFSSVSNLTMVSTEELAAIEGLNEEVAAELQRRAADAVESQNSELTKLKVSDDLLNLEGLNLDVLMILARKKIKTLDDFAELATDELLEMLPDGLMKEADAENLIMAARKHWFDDEDEENDEDGAAA